MEEKEPKRLDAEYQKQLKEREKELNYLRNIDRNYLLH